MLIMRVFQREIRLVLNEMARAGSYSRKVNGHDGPAEENQPRLIR